MIYNIGFLALASYFRPLYAFFSLFFFYEFILKDFKFNYFFIYIFISALLAFPALYYIFILKVVLFLIIPLNNDGFDVFMYSVLLFFLIPFIFFTSRYSYFKLKKINIFLTIIFSISLSEFFSTIFFWWWCFFSSTKYFF